MGARPGYGGGATSDNWFDGGLSGSGGGIASGISVSVRGISAVSVGGISVSVGGGISLDGDDEADDRCDRGDTSIIRLVDDDSLTQSASYPGRAVSTS